MKITFKVHWNHVFSLLTVLLVLLSVSTVTYAANETDRYNTVTTAEDFGKLFTPVLTPTGNTLNINQDVTYTATGEKNLAIIGNVDIVLNFAENATLNMKSYLIIPAGRSTLTIKGEGTLKSSSPSTVIQIGTTYLEGTGTVNLENNAKITNSAETGAGIGIINGSLNVNGGSITTNRSFAIYTNGSDTQQGSTLNINSGTITSSSAPAVYLPSKNLTAKISGGTITGGTGVEIRGGSLTVSNGATIKCSEGIDSTTVKPTPSQGGSTVIGAGIAISPYPSFGPTVNIQGGNISGPSGVALANAYSQDLNSDFNTVNISGGTISSTNGSNGYAVNSVRVDSSSFNPSPSNIISGGIFEGQIINQESAVNTGKYIVADVDGKTCIGKASISEAANKNGSSTVTIKSIPESDNGAISTNDFLPKGTTIKNGTNGNITVDGVTVQKDESTTVTVPETGNPGSGPNTPSRPGTPSTPSYPNGGGIINPPSNNPTTPDTPNKPDTPETPDTPDQPATPDKPTNGFTWWVPGAEDESNTIPPSEIEEEIDVYRLYNTVSGEYLYTTSMTEVNTLTAMGDWRDEGIGWKAPEEGVPVYRLYNPDLGSHLYTTDTNEVSVLQTSGWIVDNGGQAVFYSGGDVPVYRLYNPTSFRHLLTADTNEYNVLAGQGWNQEGVAFYAEAL